MKRLLLLRHAKAVPAEAGRADFSRPLAPRGEADAKLMGGRVFAHYFTPDTIVASPAARTLRTAEIAAAACNYAIDGIRHDERLYLAAPGDILAVLTALDAALTTVLVVGHNPGLTDLARALAPGFYDELPTCGLAALEMASGDWASVGTQPLHLAGYDYPKKRLATPR